jgi:hypothetical protein
MERPKLNIQPDEDHGTVTINGQVFSGFVQDFECEVCNAPIVYDDDFDSQFCPGCNVWTEKHPVCSDKSCPYCNKVRPEKPLIEMDNLLTSRRDEKDEMTPYAEVQVVFLPASQGGREKMPFLDDQCYRPHFRVSPNGDMLGVEFVDGPDGPVSPSIPTFATVRLVYSPKVSYEALRVGAKFEILEGPHIVGHGKVTKR